MSETFVLRQITGLLDAGIEVDILCAERGDMATLSAGHARYELAQRTHLIRSSAGGKLAKQLVLAARFLLGSLLAPARLITAVRVWRGGLHDVAKDIVRLSALPRLPTYDNIIAHFGTSGVWAMYMQQAGLLHGRLLTVLHGYDLSVHDVVNRYLSAYRELFVHPGICLPISDHWRERLKSWGCPPEKIQVLRMGVDVERIAFPSPERSLGTPLRMLSVARLTEKKGIEYGIRALALSKAPVEYNIIGGGELLGSLKALASELGVAPRVKFLGEQNHQAVFEHLRHSDIFLLPSVTASSGDMEGIPVALMEAMANGIVTISTRHSGIPELLDHGRTGFLVGERNAGDIAETLDALAAGQYDIAGLRRAARARVEHTFNARTLDQQLLRLLESGERPLTTLVGDEQADGFVDEESVFVLPDRRKIAAYAIIYLFH